jgi:hypothetical protein
VETRQSAYNAIDVGSRLFPQNPPRKIQARA